VAPRLTDRYLAATEERAELCLQLGRHHTLAAELAPIIAAHPFREHLIGLQMTALARSGRRADALATYHHLRRTLRDQLGVDPATPLQKLHLKILRANPELDTRWQYLSSFEIAT
jgi:DNA-binding SARP family transcriptional activator